MADLENGGFEDWNQGTFFGDPTTGTELADSWYINVGTATPSWQIIRNTGGSEGTYSMLFNASTSQTGGPNTSTYIYQDITNYTDYQGLTLTLSGDIASIGIGNPPGLVFIDDGITVSYSNPTTGVSGFETATVIKTISPVATRFRVGFMPTIYGTILADNFFITIALIQQLNDALELQENFQKILNNAIAQSLTDSLVVSDALIPPTGPVTRNKGTGDSMRIQDWLKITRHPGKWGN